MTSKSSLEHFRYRIFGDPPSQRSAEDLAYSVARFKGWQTCELLDGTVILFSNSSIK